MPSKSVVRNLDEIFQRLKELYGTLRDVFRLSNPLLAAWSRVRRCSLKNRSFFRHYWSRGPRKPELHFDGAQTASRNPRSINGNHAYDQYYNLFGIPITILLPPPYTLIHSTSFDIYNVYCLLLLAPARLIFGKRTAC
jgi:hypothetical protein